MSSNVSYAFQEGENITSVLYENFLECIIEILSGLFSFNARDFIADFILKQCHVGRKRNYDKSLSKLIVLSISRNKPCHLCFILRRIVFVLVIIVLYFIPSILRERKDEVHSIIMFVELVVDIFMDEPFGKNVDDQFKRK